MLVYPINSLGLFWIHPAAVTVDAGPGDKHNSFVLNRINVLLIYGNTNKILAIVCTVLAQLIFYCIQEEKWG